MTRREQLAQRLTTVPPTDLERDPVGVVMCELLADLLDVLTATQPVGQDPAGTSDTAGRDGDAPAAGPTDDQEPGGAPVQPLLEPDVPAEPGRGEPINDARDGAVADAPRAAGKTGRPSRAAARKKTTPAKASPDPAQ